MFGRHSLGEYYRTNFGLMQHHKYSLTELDDMIPWEREIYISLLLQYLKEREDAIKQQQNR
jgi:hypothetical protein